MQKRCPDCDNIYGTFASFEHANGKCHHCHGEGKYASMAFGVQVDCDECNGTGICQTCHGDGEADVHDPLFDEPLFDLGGGNSASYRSSSYSNVSEPAPQTSSAEFASSYHDYTDFSYTTPISSRRPAPVFDEKKALLGALLLGATAGVVGFAAAYYIIGPVGGWILWALSGGLYRPPDHGLTYSGAVNFVTFLCVAIPAVCGGWYGWRSGYSDQN